MAAPARLYCESLVKLQIWKQFTTEDVYWLLGGELWILGKITNLKAIHNYNYCWIATWKLWILGKITNLKAIHNKGCDCLVATELWILGKITNLKAIHNAGVAEIANYEASWSVSLR